MAHYQRVELTAAEIGKQQAEMYASLISNLKEKGISDELIDEIAVKVSGAALCIADGCKGVMDPFELVSNPLKSRM